MTSFPTEADRLSEAAHRDFEAGRLPEALAGCMAAIRASGRHRLAMNLAAVILREQGRFAEAEAILRDALAEQPGNIDLLQNLLVVLSDAGSWTAAERAGRALAALEPGRTIVWDRMAAVAHELGDAEAAMCWGLRTVRLAPSPLRFSNLEQTALLGGDARLSLECARRFILLEPDSATAHYFFGNALLTLGRVQEAARWMVRSYRLDPQGDGARGCDRTSQYLAASAAAATPAPGLAIRGSFGPVSGYGHFTHRLIRTLRARQVPVHAIGLMGGERWPDEPLDAAVPARAVVQCVIPVAIEPIPGLLSVVYSMFEATRIPPAWRRQSDAADLIVVPTRSSLTAWADAGFPEDRLRLCPLGVDPMPALDGTGRLVLDHGGGRRPIADIRHRILNVSDANARKNIDGLLRVWLRATRADDDAVLILKVGKGESEGLTRWLRAIVERVQAQTGRRLADAAPVLLLSRSLSEPEMEALFRTATHYWSLSHGEGWDLPMTKAGALGLGLIAPAHSSYVDYLDDSVARMIPSTVQPAIEPGTGVFYKPFHGLDWWVPDEDAAAQALVDVIRGGVVLPSARDRLLRHFTWDRSADRLLAILAEAGVMEPGAGDGR